MTDLNTLIFYATPEHDCSYLPEQKAITAFADPRAQIDKATYGVLSELGFRRSGSHFYRPHCAACRACVPVRIVVEDYAFSRRERRILKKNLEIEARIIKPYFYEEHYQLYERYIIERHRDGDMYPPSRDQYYSFLVESNADTLFVEFQLNDKLLAISVMDVLPDGLSAVYTFFDTASPELSLGSYAILWQILETQKRALPHLYLGYWVSGCQKMDYKRQFKNLQGREEDTWTNLSD